MMNLRSTGRMYQSKILPGLSGFFASSDELVAEPFQNTRRLVLVEPCIEHSTAQSVCPGLANSPRITFAFRSVNGCGIVHPRPCSSATKFFGSSGNAVGTSRLMGYVRCGCVTCGHAGATTNRRAAV